VPTETNVAINRHAANFESVVPLLNLSDAHGIVAENPLNLPNGFHMTIAKLVAKFDAIPPYRVAPSFFQKMTMRHALLIYSQSHAVCTRLTLSAGGKKNTYVHEGPLHLPATAHLPYFISFCGKKITSRTF
jgi:hypothetical protein